MLTIYLSMLETEEDKSKFQAIYEKYNLLIYHEAHKITTDQYLVDDIVQETFLKIIQRISTLRYDNDKEFAGLICTMTKNCGNTYMGKNKKYVYPEEMPEEDISALEADLEKRVVDVVTVGEVIKIIEEMDPMFAEPLKLKIRGYSSEEIGRLLDISSRNARVRICRAKKMIADKLEDYTNE